jgi:hypothetical protein
VRLLQVLVARESTDAWAFAREIATALEPYRRLVWDSDRPWLARVHETHALPPTGPDDGNGAARSIANGAVLCYGGDPPWWDVHPEVLGRLDDARVATQRRGQS